MYSAIVGDILGSVHERLPNSTSIREAGPTDDSFLTCAAYEWINSLSLNEIDKCKNDLKIQEKFKNEAIFYLKKWWAKYPNEGFSKGFKAWAANPVYVQAHRNTNGSLMRQSSIAGFCVKNKIDLDICLILVKIFASPTHDHEETYPAINSHATSIYLAHTNQLSMEELKISLEYTPYKIFPLEYWKEIKKFIWDAPNSLAIAYSALYYANTFQSTIDNCIYIGGDVDTYCAIACPIAEGFWKIPANIVKTTNHILKKYPDVENLFIKN